MKTLDIIKQMYFFKELKEKGAKIYLVGGIVRDFFLKKESKDIDLVVSKLDESIILNVLEKYGKVDKVGETFGVLKFIPFGWTEEPIDIALPRIDTLLDKSLGHHGIKAYFDKDITIEDDLYRRDFTFNSIAIDCDGVFIDPYNGREDIENKIIRATSKQSFSDDPLRILRALQLSSRFDFIIEDETWKMIVENSQDILTISGERILEELNKIFYKGNKKYGLKLLKDSKIQDILFKKHITCDFIKSLDLIQDFYFYICKGCSDSFKNTLKGDNDTFKAIKAIEKLYEFKTLKKEKWELRKMFFEALQISTHILYSKAIPYKFYTIQKEFLTKYPKSIKELDITGEDLISLGFEGKSIGIQMKFLLDEILKDNTLNKKEELVSYYEYC